MRFPRNGNQIVVRSPKQVQEIASHWRVTGKSVGFVPTMGCLHDGHMSLVRAARKNCERVIVSIFVNPLQFGKNEDLGIYPRTFDRDLEQCKNSNVDLVFYPNLPEFYPRTFVTKINSGPFGKKYCGKTRPVFFDGILTVLNILFNITQPHSAYFGEKDFQQLHLIRQLVRDFRFPVEVVGMPIIREPSGLAMSSRNEFLSDIQKEKALCLYQAIEVTRSNFQNGDTLATSLLQKATNFIAKCAEFSTDYVHIVDEKSLEPLSGEIMKPARLLLAGYIGENPKIRLIDNGRVNF